MIDSFANIDIQSWKTVLEHDLPLKPGSTFVIFAVILKVDASPAWGSVGIFEDFFKVVKKWSSTIFNLVSKTIRI